MGVGGRTAGRGRIYLRSIHILTEAVPVKRLMAFVVSCEGLYGGVRLSEPSSESGSSIIKKS